MIDLSLARDKIKKTRAVFFDFDGVFTDNSVYVSEDGKESVRCWRSDGLGLEKLRHIGFYHQIISTEKNPAVLKRAQKLKIKCVNGIQDKYGKLKEIAKSNHFDLGEIIFVGNDINDLECLRNVGVAIMVADAHPSLLSENFFVTTMHGGYGAVREVCDLIHEVHSDRKLVGERS